MYFLNLNCHMNSKTYDVGEIVIFDDVDFLLLFELVTCALASEDFILQNKDKKNSSTYM